MEVLETLEKTADSILEELVKSCPRCGSKSANKSNPSGRCGGCLKKLSANKKKPGHYLHEHKLADDALKRQDGKTKTSTKKTKGRGTRKAIISKVRAAYKKHGKSTVLSPDRKQNSAGYGSENTRMVPAKLNRGTHKVDPKKLAAWKQKLKKGDEDLLLAALLQKAVDAQNTSVLETLANLEDQTLLDLFFPDDDTTHE